MTTRLNFGRDINGKNAFGPEISTDIYTASLTNGSEQTFTVPSDSQKWLASFSYQAGTVNWVAVNNTAAVPAGASFASADSVLNPGVLQVNAGDVIHVITATATSEVSVSLYSIGNQV